MQATEAGGALRLCPDGGSPSRISIAAMGAALGAEAAIDAEIVIDSKLARPLHARQPKRVICARCKQGHAIAHHVARTPRPYRFDHGINLRLGSLVDALDL